LPEGVDYREFPSLPGMMKMLDTGRADVILDYEEDVIEALREAKVEASYEVRKHVVTSPLYAGFSHSASGMRAREIFRQRLPVLIADMSAKKGASVSALKMLIEKYDVPFEDRPHLINAGKTLPVR
jgi:ABC-type amino acid transport substrate-binding protein